MKIGIPFLFLLLLPTSVFAGQVFGAVREGNNSVGPNVRVEIQCGNATYGGPTDQYGSYKIYVPNPGPCTLRVYYHGQVPDIPVQSYADPQRYDLLLVYDGRTYSLRRT